MILVDASTLIVLAFIYGVIGAVTYAFVHYLIEHRGHRCKWIIYREEMTGANTYRDAYCKCGGRLSSYRRPGKSNWNVIKLTRPIREEGTS